MTSNRHVAYGTPVAFRRALTDKLRALASVDGSWPLSDLQRQFAYDRLLVRLYLLDTQGLDSAACLSHRRAPYDRR